MGNKKKRIRGSAWHDQRTVLYRHVYFGWRQFASIFLRLWLSRRWQLPGRHERKYFFTNRMNLDYCCTIRLHAGVFSLTAPKYVSRNQVFLCPFGFVMFCCGISPGHFSCGSCTTRPIVEKMAASRDGMKHNNTLFMQLNSIWVFFIACVKNTTVSGRICMSKWKENTLHRSVIFGDALTDASRIANCC